VIWPARVSDAAGTIATVEYQALYRKYRPQRFEDVVGQQHVTDTLAREVEEAKVAHAYLFAGPRGTGKTTTARILAKTLNCTSRGVDGEPCDRCDSCVAVRQGSSMDVIEMDAASHNKVEDVRDIRVSVSTVASVGGAKRVFILDEAHMLTKAAGNALLKTLEEPPEHVHFVLATTEPYKLLDTIRSRSQRFDFHPVGVEVLASYLSKISDHEGYSAADGALMAVARHAGGSVRDSLSLLEQVAALGGGRVDDAGVRRALGLAGRDAYFSLAQAISGSDAAAALTMVAELAGDGVDLRMFVADAISFFRGVFLTRYAPNVSEIVDEPGDVLEDWRKVADLLQPNEILRSIDVLSEGLIKLREGREERLMFELSLLKLTRPEVSVDDPAALASRMERLEQKLNRFVAGGTTEASAPAVAASPAPTAAPPVDAGTVPPPSRQPEELPSGPAATPATAATAGPDQEAPFTPTQPDASGASSPGEEGSMTTTQPSAEAPGGAGAAEPGAADLERIWPQLVAGVRNDLGARREAMLREAMPDGVEGSTLMLGVPAHLDFHLEQLRSDEGLHRYLAEKAAALLGGRVEVEFRSVGGGGTPVPRPPVGVQAAESSSPTPEPTASSEGDEFDDADIPDKDRLEEAPAAGTDPLALLESELGAEVIDD
jgi:DNA polymerase-3 subunit gamma/tau